MAWKSAIILLLLVACTQAATLPTLLLEDEDMKNDTAILGDIDTIDNDSGDALDGEQEIKLEFENVTVAESNTTNSTSEDGVAETSTSEDGVTETIKSSGGNDESTSDDIQDLVDKLNKTCEETKTFTIIYEKNKYASNGDLIPYNVSKTVTTKGCCDGYFRTADDRCILDYCKYFQCGNSSRCAVVKRCEEVFPICVDERGFLSKNCTQPKMSEKHLCPNDVCDPDSQCETRRDVVCLANQCGCSAGHFWQGSNLRVLC